MSFPSSQTHLLILQDDTGTHELILRGTSYVIGREVQCDICLISQFVSRRHARLLPIRQADGTQGYQIVDGDRDGIKSANGILINGHKLRTHILENEDEITFGPGVRATYYRLQRQADEDDDGSLPTAPVKF